jgi:hypothetical protein
VTFDRLAVSDGPVERDMRTRHRKFQPVEGLSEGNKTGAPSSEVSVRDILHEIRCNIVLDSPKRDRFYMDMRVYQVVPHSISTDGVPDASLLWRGIYLAVEVNPSSQQETIRSG